MLLEMPLALGGLGLSTALLIPGALAALASAKPPLPAWATLLGVAAGAGAFHLLAEVFNPAGRPISPGERVLGTAIAVVGLGLAALSGLHLRLDPPAARGLGGLGLAMFAGLAGRHLARVIRARPAP